MWLHLMLTLMCLCISTASLAYGTEQHVLGTVAAIHGTRIEVKTPMGGTVGVRVDKQTRFKEKNSPRGAHIPMVGDRVIITATKSDKLLLATEVYFSSARRVPAHPDGCGSVGSADSLSPVIHEHIRLNPGTIYDLNGIANPQ